MKKKLLLILNTVLLNLLVYSVYSEITQNLCVEILKKQLSTDDKSLKIYFLNQVKDTYNPIFFTELKKLVKEKDDNIRLKSAYVLGKVYKDTSTINIAIDILNQKPEIKNVNTPIGKAKLFIKNQIRAEAAKLLGEIGDEKIVPLLEKYKDDSDGIIVDSVYYALFKLMLRKKINVDTEVLEFFYSGLKDTNPKVRLQAVKYLGELKDTNAVQPILLRLKDQSKEVRAESVLSLCKIGDTIILQDIIYLKKDKEDTLRARIADGLGIIGEKLIKSTDSINIAHVNKIKGLLVEYLNDYNGTVRVNAAVSLLRLNDRSGIEQIKKGLSSEDTDVVIYCIESLGEYGNKEDLVLLEKFITNKDTLLNLSSAISCLKILAR